MRTWNADLGPSSTPQSTLSLLSLSLSLSLSLCLRFLCCGANNLRNLPPSVLSLQQTANTPSRGQATHRSAMTMNVDEEIERLRAEIERLGAKQPDGSIVVSTLSVFLSLSLPISNQCLTPPCFSLGFGLTGGARIALRFFRCGAM
jgi:hypothetical protein